MRFLYVFVSTEISFSLHFAHQKITSRNCFKQSKSHTLFQCTTCKNNTLVFYLFILVRSESKRQMSPDRSTFQTLTADSEQFTILNVEGKGVSPCRGRRAEKNTSKSLVKEISPAKSDAALSSRFR